MGNTAIHINQNLLDVAVQHCGMARDFVAIAQLNGLALTDDIAPGTVLELVAVSDAKTVTKLLPYGNVPVTAIYPFSVGTISGFSGQFLQFTNTSIIPGTVHERQTIQDVAIQWCGSPEDVVQVAQLNGIGITDDVAEGTVLLLPAKSNAAVVSGLVPYGNVPVSGIEAGTAAPTGIGYWFIENDFIVQ
jgi:hypothetical protein